MLPPFKEGAQVAPCARCVTCSTVVHSLFIGGSTVHIRQQHVIDHLQDMQRDALPMLQGRFDTGDILRAGCIVVVRLPAARAAVRPFHGFTFFPVRL